MFDAIEQPAAAGQTVDESQVQQRKAELQQETRGWMPRCHKAMHRYCMEPVGY
ncbi:MAG: hypothetical protein HYX42_14095 [Polaromonas sp.]|uniref:hypothetical protein n=1 Tax=Polaromonas sp. TaxID=1869339 RepID=UPI0025DDDAE1|nr:hypothetical protein [Polaromonas sp.]MBI2727369.1 hypothetical protein [Polaromonas sp.]